MSNWSTSFPTETGLYWFHGYNYGKVVCGEVCEPELLLVKVVQTHTGVVCIADGQFMYESEVEDPHFMIAEVPDPPIYVDT